jgi:YHS domain-containing protein
MKRALLFAVAGLTCVSVAGRLVAQEEKKVNTKCVVSGGEVTITEKTPSVSINGEKRVFCCENCPKAFAKEPEKFVKDAGKCPLNKNGAAKVSKETRTVLNNDLYYTCCGNCAKTLRENPSKSVKELKDVVTGKKFELKSDSPRAEVNGQIYLFSSADSKAAFEKESAKYALGYK